MIAAFAWLVSPTSAKPPLAKPMVKRCPSHLAALCALLSLFHAVSSKKVVGNIRIGGPKVDNHWKYITKFGYNIGLGSYALRLRPLQPHILNRTIIIDMELFLDEDYDSMEKLPVCERGPAKSKGRRDLELVSNDWGPWQNGTLHQSQRPHIWYFALSDCKEQRELSDFTYSVRYEIIALQEDGSEFSTEMRGMLVVNCLALGAFTVFLRKFYLLCREFFRSTESLHPVICVLAFVMVLQYVAQMFHTLHLLKYRSNGSGSKPLDILSEVFFMLSQVTQTTLLILIALGYTLLQSRVGELDIVVPIGMLSLVVHAWLVGFGKLQDDASYKFHENEGNVGWLLLAFRLLLYAWFVWAVRATRARGGIKLQAFMVQFTVAGSAYFLAYPLIFFITKLFAQYLQHPVWQVGQLTMQMASNVWLTTLFLYRGEYFKVSTLNSSFLPGGARVGVDKEE